MTEPKATLAERLRRLQALRSSPGQGSISTAEPLAGDWPHACQVFPASYAQSRLWFLHQLQPNLTTYHLPAFWHLNGELNLNALSQALAALIERHPTLRSSFQLQGSELLQLLHPPAPYRLEVELLGKRDLDAVIRAWQQEEASTPFDLTSGLLLRSRLLQVAADEHILLINHHHIASDSWSESVLSRDLAEFYNAYRSGRASKLPPLRVHYHDYAAWQRQRLSGDRLQQLRDYWIPKLTGLPPLDLPTDHPRPAIPSHQEARHSFSIQLALIAPFEEFCRSEGATLQMGLLALLALILHRYSRQDDLAIGISIWGRNHPDLEPLIGFFINTLPIRIHFSADLSFRQLLAQIKTTSINAYDHQELPFEQIVEALNPERDVSCNPLVQVMLQLIEPEPNLDTLDRVKVAPLLISENSLKVDLGWQFRRNARGGLTGTASYSLDLFKEEKIEGLASSFLALLEDLKDDYAGKVNLPANELRIITKDKEAQVLAWSRSISRSSKHTLIHQFVMEGVSRSEPSATAVKDAKDELSYQDLIFNSHRLANRLIGEGVKPGDRVGILLPRRVELPVALLGVLIAGGCYVAIDPAYPDKQICRRLKDAMVTVCISTPDIKKRITGFCHITLELHQPRRPESNSQQEHRELDTEEYTPTVSEDDSAYLIYTSGSTGDPKGVEVTHKAAMQMLNYRLDYLTPQWACRVVPFFSSISFDASIAQIFTVLAAGGCLAMLDTIEELKTMPLCENTTHLSGTPGAIRNLIENDLMPQTTKVIGLGGEAIDAGLCEMLRSLPSLKYIYIVYGITEAGGFSTALRIDRDKITDLAKARNNIGSPIIGVQAYITDRRMHLLPPGIPGELHIGGSGLARGYLNNPELTAQKFIPDPFSDDPSARLYKSGDLASWNPDGTLAFHGRIDQQIKLRGFRIEPAEIEANLLAHPAVAQAVIVLRHDDPANPRLIAYWVPQQTADDSPSSDQLRSFLAQRLPDYMVPSAFVALETLPLTTNGKLDRKALPAPSFAGALDQRVEPSTDVERQLHAIWAEVLGHSDFGITDNFFLVGGHSLAAARLMARIEQTSGHTPPLAALFQNPTIAALASVLLSSRVPSQTRGSIASLTERLARLQALRSSRVASTIPAADPLPGDWPSGCQAFPASYAQARLWFLQQLQPGLTAYHLPALWWLSGALDPEALAQALTDLITRHPTLRTSFQLHGSEVVQLIHPPSPIQLELESLGDRDPEAVVQAWLQQEASIPFDLASGLLLRARLLQVAADEHVFLINHHHIASDGWSLSILTRDLTALYNAQRSGQASGLSLLQVYYHDYATWQRQRLSGDRLHQLKDYWVPQLTGLEPLELPTDHPRPATPSHQGASHSFRIAPDLLAPFEQLCRSEGATLQMGLLALLALLLQRYSRQDDFAIGVPIWGRNHPDLEPLIGFFVNTLPIRSRFSADLSFRQLLNQVKTTSINAYDHQDLPFEQMVEALNLERDTSRNPLVQVMLQLIELQLPSLCNLDGLAVEPIQSSATASRFELEFFLRRDPDGGLNTTLVYATDLFCADRIQRLASHLLCLLASTLQAPDAPAASLNFLPESELQLIQTWQHGPTIDVPDLCVHQLFEQQVALTPDAIALIFENQQLTYSQLNARANQLAHHLIDLGVGPDVIVAVCLERSVELIVALLAILKAGGAYLPLDPSWPQERRTLLLTESGCAVLIAADGAQLLRVPAAATPAPPLRPLAYISYTSGSTGTPKGVAIEHQAILRLVDPINGFRLGNGAAVLQLAPVAFDAATLEIWGPLLHGGTLVLAPPGTPSLAELAACLNQHRITTLWLTAGLFHAMVDAELESLAAVPQVLAGGDVLHPASVQRLLAAFPSGHALINGYGPTENTTFTCCQRLGSDAPLTTTEVPIGSPIANTTVRVLDPSGHPCPIGIPGELHIGGSGLARGYLNNPELTAEKFIPDPFSDDPSARLYKSGDLASWNPDGTLAFHGRIDQQIKLRGFRIEPAEIEANLLAHPAVAQAVIVLRHDDPANPRLIAYWVPQQTADDSPSSDQLRSFLAQRLPDYMVPSAFVALETLPLTTNGKLDRKALPAPSFAGALDQRVEPSTDVERQLHAIWAEVLGHSDFGITDNFFLVGGHSLAAARLVSRLEQTIGSAPALAALFHNPTIAGLVQLMQGAVSGLSPSLVTLQPKGERPPLFVIHGWGGTVWGFVDLARALAPDRPVYGLQAPGVEWQRPPQGSVREMAAGYAEQILQMRPEGMIHLVGYSAGGWYAHAVAEALLERGAVVGLFAVMDTHATAQIHRRIGLFLLLEQLYSRFGKSVAGLLNLSGEESRFGYLQGRVRALKALLDRYLHIGGEGSMTANEAEGVQGSSDPFVLLLKHGYRPRRLPIKVAVFAPKPGLDRLWFLWRFYARAGVSLYPMFSDHFDFYRPELMDELAASLESALKRVELPSV